MASVSLKDINELLKDAPKNVLERVFGYIEGLRAQEDIHFELNDEQKESLRLIKERSITSHTEIDYFLSDFKSEHGI